MPCVELFRATKNLVTTTTQSSRTRPRSIRIVILEPRGMCETQPSRFVVRGGRVWARPSLLPSRWRTPEGLGSASLFAFPCSRDGKAEGTQKNRGTGAVI
jgi:hypothetical protein